MKELNEMELREVDGGGSTLKNLTWGGIALWLMGNWTDVKKGISDGWTECHSST
ncbi:MAG: hypothetical protein NTY07_13150 [Bacteroidia bacterium]|nr:hypothetical protein [Bacteroidia bacterium]